MQARRSQAIRDIRRAHETILAREEIHHVRAAGARTMPSTR
jgi:hypothetical protein